MPWGSNLLLQDLGKRRDLDASLDLSPILTGLGHIGPHESWVFVDACQAKLKRGVHFGSGGLSFDFEEGPTDGRAGWAVYSAAAEGTLAYGEIGASSLFVTALLAALRREAVGRFPAGDWGVEANSLAIKLHELVRYPGQRVWPRLEGTALPFHSSTEPPTGKLSVKLSAPPDRANRFDFSVVHDDSSPMLPRSHFDRNPYELETSPGVYIVTLHNDEGLRWQPLQRAPEVEPYRTAVAEFQA
jgi:hypothetical protein